VPLETLRLLWMTLGGGNTASGEGSGERRERVRLVRAGGGWVFSAWCLVAAFGTYFCMYAFRKPFTAATTGPTAGFPPGKEEETLGRPGGGVRRLGVVRPLLLTQSHGSVRCRPPA
jgi:hypothetical protein